MQEPRSPHAQPDPPAPAPLWAFAIRYRSASLALLRTRPFSSRLRCHAGACGAVAWPCCDGARRAIAAHRASAAAAQPAGRAPLQAERQLCELSRAAADEDARARVSAELSVSAEVTAAVEAAVDAMRHIGIEPLVSKDDGADPVHADGGSDGGAGSEGQVAPARLDREYFIRAVRATLAIHRALSCRSLSRSHRPRRSEAFRSL
jgi:hypothetical protein